MMSPNEILRDEVVDLSLLECLEPSEGDLALFGLVSSLKRAPARLKCKGGLSENIWVRQLLYLDRGGTEFWDNLELVLGYTIPEGVPRAIYDSQTLDLPWKQYGPDGVWCATEAIPSPPGDGGLGTYLRIAWWSQFPREIHVHIAHGILQNNLFHSRISASRQEAWKNVYLMRYLQKESFLQSRREKRQNHD